MDALITAVISGKGGTGKSVTSVFVSAALAALGKKVVLVELAPGMRSVDIIAGVSEQAVFDISDVLSGQVPPAKAVVESSVYPGLHVLPAPYAGGRIVPKMVQQLCVRLRPHFEFIMLDVAAGYGPAFQTAAAVAHRFILVETPDPLALRDGRALVDFLEGHPAPMRLVLNRVDPVRVLYDGVLRDLDEAIDMVGAQLLGVVPESALVRKAGAGVATLSPKSEAGGIYQAIARRILGEDIPLIIE
jgi:septum site-determining protein MinD